MKSVQKIGLLVLVFSFFSQAIAQKKTQSFTVSRLIPASADEVWAVVGEDYGAIANSHPKIISSAYLNGSLKGGEGAERVCHMNEKKTKFIHEKQLEYDAENYRFKVQVFHAEGLPLDPEHSYAVYKVVPLGRDKSRLEFSMSFRTNPAFMGAMAKGNFKKTVADYLLAVEHHIKTGDKVNKDNFKSIKKQYGE